MGIHVKLLSTTHNKYKQYINNDIYNTIKIKPNTLT